MKQLYSTLALLVVALGVGAWIYFNERGPVAEQGSTVLLRTTPSSVQRVVLQRPDGKRVKLSREGQEWRVQQEGVNAVAVPADADAVKALLDATQLLQSAAVVENADSKKLQEFGLARPQSTLLIDESKIEFGTKPSFDTTKTYSRVTSTQSGGSRIALLPATLADFPGKPFDEWRDKSALHIDDKSVSKLQIKAPAVTASFERTKKAQGEGELDEWKLSQPVSASADAITIGSFLQQLPQTKTSKFLQDNPKNLAQWGLDKPTAVLTVAIDDGERTLRIGKKLGDGRAAQNSFSNAVFVVPESLFGLINRPLLEWRDKTILKFNTTDVRSIKVLARGRSAELQSDTSGDKMKWKRIEAAGSGQSEKVAEQSALDILVGIQGLSATDIIDNPKPLSTYGLDKPVVELRLQSGEWQGERVLQIGTHNGQTYARSGAGNTFHSQVYVLATTTLESFKPSLDSLFPSAKNISNKKP